MDLYETYTCEFDAETSTVVVDQVADVSTGAAQPAPSATPGSSMPSAWTSPPKRRSTRRAFEAPDLVGLGLPAAIELAETSALTVVVATAEGRTDRVIAQRPAPGAPVRRGSSIHVDLAGAGEVPVPDVCLASEPDAIDRIVLAGLRPGTRNPRRRPASGRKEVVIRTRPPAGTSVPLGSQVSYELLSCRPCWRGPQPTGYEDFDAASTIEGKDRSPTPQPVPDDHAGMTATLALDGGYVDYDSIETSGRAVRAYGGRAGR